MLTTKSPDYDYEDYLREQEQLQEVEELPEDDLYDPAMWPDEQGGIGETEFKS